MTERRYQLVTVSLVAALGLQIVIPYLPMERLYEPPPLQVVVVQAQVLPTEPPVTVAPTTTPELTTTPVPVIETPRAEEGTAAKQAAVEPVITTTKEPVDLVQECQWANNLVDAERTYALAQITWDPDYAGAKVIPSCNVVVGNKPKAVVLHFTQGELSGAIARFQQKDEASAHYIVDRDGTVIQMVPEHYGAKHVNCWGQRSYCLASCPICEDEEGRLVEPYLRSVGIEIVNQGAVDPKVFSGLLYEDYNMAYGYRYWEDYPEVQLESLKALVEDICARWGIPLDAKHLIGHSLVNMKSDPGPALNIFWPRYGEPAREALWP